MKPINAKNIQEKYIKAVSQACESHKNLPELRKKLLKLQRKLVKFLVTLEQETGDENNLITSHKDLFQLCRLIDDEFRELLSPDDKKSEISLNEEEMDIIRSIRAKIATLVIEDIYDNKRQVIINEEGTQFSGTQKHLRLIEEKELVKDVFELMRIIQAKDDDEVVTPEWIELNHEKLYYKLYERVYNHTTSIVDWSLIGEMLPKDARQCCDFQRRQLKMDKQDQRIRDLSREYREIAELLGPEALADFIVNHYKESVTKDFSHVLRIISRYLGRTSRKVMTPQDFPNIPSIALEHNRDLRDVVSFSLRVNFYRKFMKVEGEMKNPKKAKQVFTGIQKEFLQELKSRRKGSNKDFSIHEELITEVIKEFLEAIDLPIDPRLETTIKGKDGEPIEIPALRQRIAMMELKKDKRKIISFFMGKGKTATAFFCKEHVKSKKMLFVCPQGALPATIAKQIKKHYKKNKTPKVEIIGPKTTSEDLQRIKDEAEIIIMPYSMLGAERGDNGGEENEEKRKITEQLYDIGIDMMVVDEVQNAKKEGHLYTEEVFNLSQNINGLKDGGGHIMLLSGDPVPNGPNDILPQLRICEPEKFDGKLRTLRHWLKQKDPLELRQLLLKYILKLDSPEEWERYTERMDIVLGPNQQHHYDTLLQEVELDTNEKLRQLMLAIINPHIHSPVAAEDAMVDSFAESILGDFQEYDAVVVAEDSYKQGVLRQHSDSPDAPTFVEKLEKKLKEQLGNNVEVLIYDGDTSNKDKEKYLKKLQNPKKKTVMVAMLSMIHEGIDLSYIHRAYVLEPTMRKSDLAQLTKRFAREGNEDVKIRVPMVHRSAAKGKYNSDNSDESLRNRLSINPKEDVEGTIYEGIYEHALYKYVLAQRLLEGGTITADDLAYMEDGDLSDVDINYINGKLHIGSSITSATLNNLQILNAFFAHLHNVGEDEFKKFISDDGGRYTEAYMFNWEGGYSANNGRFVSGLIQNLKKDKIIKGNQMLDVASGPLVLENTYGVIDPKANIVSCDLNPHILQAGVDMARAKRLNADYEPTKICCGMNKLEVDDGGYDVVNSSLAFHYLNHSGRTKIPQNHERIKVLVEMNRKLKKGGTLILTIPQAVCTDEEFENFQEIFPKLGFEVLSKYSGAGNSTDDEGSPFANRVLVCKKVAVASAKNIETEDLKNLQFTRGRIPKGKGVRRKKGRNLAEPSIHTEFEINDIDLSFKEASTDNAKLDRAKYQMAVIEARTLLVGLYEKNDLQFDKLSSEVAEELDMLRREKGIHFLKTPAGGGKFRYTFSLTEYSATIAINHPLFENTPYDDEEDE